MSNRTDQKQREDETEAYKMFSKVARKIKRIDYANKWEIEPDLTDPLRKIVLTRDIGWCKLNVHVSMRQSYHRSDYSENRYFWYGQIAFSGMFRDLHADIVLETEWRLKPRMARKLLAKINENIIPAFYEEVENERKNVEEARANKSAFAKNVQLVKGMTITKRNQWNDTAKNGVLEGCPLEIMLEPENVHVSGEIPYAVLAEWAVKLGWGK